MAALHTPRELEIIIKHELGREREVPDWLIVQIFRDGDSWRAGSRWRHRRHDEIAKQITARVSEISSQVAKQHRLIG